MLELWKKFGLQLGISIALHALVLFLLSGIILYQIPDKRESMESAGVFASATESEIQDEDLFLEDVSLDLGESLEVAEGLDVSLPIISGPEIDVLPDDLTDSMMESVSVVIPSSSMLLDGESLGVALSGSGMGSGMGSRVERKASQIASTFSFFGVEESAERIVIAFDVSSSVLTKAKAVGVTTERMKEEAMKLLRELTGGTQFGLVQFVRNYKQFDDGLVKASARNVRDAKTWMEQEFVSSGSMPASGKGVIKKDPNGIESVLKQTFAWDPDVIYLISDGSFYRGVGMEKVPYEDIDRLMRELQKGRGHKVKVHFIGFEVREKERKQLNRIVTQTGGSLVDMSVSNSR